MADKQIKQMLALRQNSLSKIIRNAEKKLLQAPPGTVEIKRHGNGLQFYHRSNPHEKHGQYIRAADRKRAVALAQKRYLTRLACEAKKQHDLIAKFLQDYDPDALESVFRSEGKARQSLIQPIELPDEAFVSDWVSVEYEGKGFSENAPTHFTQKRERVRSKSEVMIANALFRAGIPYKYECPLSLKGFTAYPDFTILRVSDRKVLYWEHLGLIDDTEYRNSSIYKIRSYEESGIFPGDNLILSVESNKVPLNEIVIQRLIKHYLLC